MENPSSSVSSGRTWNRGGFEENVLAILDASEAKDTEYAHDDRIAFLDAVRAAFVVPEHEISPTYKIFEAVFRILRMGNSLELIVASYQLLIELEKRFPRVYLSNTDNSNSLSKSSSELVVVKEAWSPIVISLDNGSSVGEAADKQSEGPLNSTSFHLLIEELVEMLTETKFVVSGLKPLQNLLLFQYLVNVLEGDFLPRNATMNWNVQRESLLNMLLGSRKINYKSLMKDCLAVVCQLSQLPTELSKSPKLLDNSDSGLSRSCHTALSIALLEVRKNSCVSMEKLLVMIMELDLSRKKADFGGYTTRGDGLRTPLVEIILDELTYNEDIVPLFFQNFSDPKWKLEIVVQYFWKYISKPSVRTRRSSGSNEDATFNGALKCFSNNTGTKSIIKKIGGDVVQFLLAHGFQAQLSILSEGHAVEDITDHEGGRASALVDLSKNIISAFDSLRSTDEHMAILSIGKEALFTAATIISTKS